MKSASKFLMPTSDSSGAQTSTPTMTYSSNTPIFPVYIAFFSLLCAISFACFALLICAMYLRKVQQCRSLKERLKASAASARDVGLPPVLQSPQTQPTSSRCLAHTDDYDVLPEDGLPRGRALAYGLPRGRAIASPSLTSSGFLKPAGAKEASYASTFGSPFSSVSPPANAASSSAQPRAEDGGGFSVSYASTFSKESISFSGESQQPAVVFSSNLCAPGLRKIIFKPKKSPPQPPPADIVPSRVTSEALYEEIGTSIEGPEAAAESDASDAATSATPAASSRVADAVPNADCEC